MEKNSPKIFNVFVRIGHLEGVSYLLLLGIAMPLKYWYGMPQAVKVVGMIHGILFIGYCVLLIMAMNKMKWSLLKTSLAFLLSLVPFGTFLLHKFK